MSKNIVYFQLDLPANYYFVDNFYSKNLLIQVKKEVEFYLTVFFRQKKDNLNNSMH